MATPEPGYTFTPGPDPEALRYFRTKGVNPAFDYRDVWREEHATAFTLAKITEPVLLADVRESLTAAMKEGKSFGKWTRELRPELEKMRLMGHQGNARPQARLGPFLEHRLQHSAWAALILAADSPLWASHYPPNDQGCKSYVRQLTRHGGPSKPPPSRSGAGRTSAAARRNSCRSALTPIGTPTPTSPAAKTRKSPSPKS